VTDALRRRADRVVSSAVHLLVDAWPSGWPKTLVSCDRTPKRGYFALRDAHEPLRAHLRTDRHHVWAGGRASVEVWTLNDTPDAVDAELRVAVRHDDDTLSAFAEPVTLDQVSGEYVGSATVDVPEVTERMTLAVDAALVADGAVINTERLELTPFPRPGTATAQFLGEGVPDRFEGGPVDIEPYEPGAGPETIVVESPAALEDHRTEVLAAVEEGGRLVLLRQGGTAAWDLGDRRVETTALEGMWGHEAGLSFVARDADHPATAPFEPMDFAYRYSGVSDRIDYLADSYLDDGAIRPLLYTYDGVGDFEGTVEGAHWDRDHAERVPVVGQLACGDGDVIASELRLAGRVGVEPVIDHLLVNLLGDD